MTGPNRPWSEIADEWEADLRLAARASALRAELLEAVAGADKYPEEAAELGVRALGLVAELAELERWGDG